ncbi:hypothetical protein GALMADRAFT_1230715 [Galerina marginata CBS 339.88]|uniref:Uncharacterized protein n=1 Tax=Galerina marginata (strain CBS 339.88) TaxID=685588 RepID=A0A067TJV4_GALM3|nr:hypothetical protein GALMADRAFT_1230715 [Galerina marginata CBS 339.88]
MFLSLKYTNTRRSAQLSPDCIIQAKSRRVGYTDLYQEADRLVGSPRLQLYYHIRYDNTIDDVPYLCHWAHWFFHK